MDFEKAIEKIFEGNCILFTGSGFSFGAENVLSSNSDIKSSPDLAKILNERSGYTTSNTDLKKATTAYLRKKTELDLIDMLKQEFTISKISSDHKYIGSLYWSRLYTTNYDGILETSYRQNKKGTYLTPVTLSNNPKDFPDRRKVVVHLNGYIDNLTPSTLNSEFRLSNRSYLTDDFEKSKWVELFKGDIKACDAIFFVGFSLDYDLDISRIIYDGDIRDKAFFIIWDREDEVNKENIKEFGDVQAISLSGFVQKIREIQRTYTPPVTKIFEPLCFSQPRLDNNLPTIKDSDFYDLLLLGKLNEHILYHSLVNSNDYKYFSYREMLLTTKADIKNGENSILVESNLGNGKSLFLRALSVLLAKDGYKVFFFEKHRATIEREMQRICDDFDNAVVIFDDYHTVREQIAFFCQRRKNQILITSERTHIHEVTYDDIERTIGEYKTINLDLLSNEELIVLDKYLSDYSLWKELTTKENERILYMTSVCKSQLCNIILSRITSTDLSSRIQKVINDTKNRKGYYNALITILVSKTFGFNLELSDLVEILGANTLNNPSFKSNASIREFVDFGTNQITFRSSIMSQYILGNLIQPEIVIDTLIFIAKALDNKYSVNYNSKEFLKSIVTFRTIQKSINLNDSKWKGEIFRFYETIKDLQFCRSNIHFWLQYAIARLSDYDYTVAGAYFEKCYAFAKQRGYDTYQIDNHYCRFILENEIDSGNISTCMDAFDKAHSILMNTRAGDEKKYYPYKAAGKYELFYRKFYKELQPHHKKKFLNACEEMLKKCQNYMNLMGDAPYVKGTKKSLEQILSDNPTYS